VEGIPGLRYSVEVDPVAGSWIGAIPASGFAPGTVQVFVTPGSLPPGSYRATVRISVLAGLGTAPVAAHLMRSVPVILRVREPEASPLVTSDTGLSFTVSQGSAP